VEFYKLNGCTNPSKVPTYEFTCPKGHDFDKFFRSMASAPMVVACPVCGKPADRQMSAGTGLIFHGTGFYITDYGKDGKKEQKRHVHREIDAKKELASESGSAESGGSPESATAVETRAEAKPEPKSGAGAAEPKTPKAPKAKTGGDGAGKTSASSARAATSSKASE